MDISLKGLWIATSSLLKLLVAAGIVSLAMAVVNERRMQKYRRPSVTYADVTLRRDGAWHREDFVRATRSGVPASGGGVGRVRTLLLLLAILLAWLSG